MTIQILEACDYTSKNSDGDFYSVSVEDTYFCKRFFDSKEYNASARKRYKLGSFHEPSGLVQLLPLLQRLELDRKKLIIRHKYSKASKGDKVFRRADLVESVPSKLIAIDVDSIRRPDYIDATDLRGQGNYICNLLHKCDPETFPDDMGFIVQGSAKAGLTDNIRVHLWLENYYELTQGQLRNVFIQINSEYKNLFSTDIEFVDTTLYHDVQIHYTAAPIFEPKNRDPFLVSPRTVYQYGNLSYIPDTVSSYSKSFKTSEEEVFSYLNSIEGGEKVSEQFNTKWSIVRDWEAGKSGLRTKVISLYHEAIQDVFNIELLDKMVAEVLSKKRPGQEQYYINQAKASAVSAIKNNSERVIPDSYLNINIPTLDSGDLPKYLDVKNLPNEGVVFLKATLGTGKTYTIEKWLEQGKLKGKFLALTDTSALVESNAARFNAGDFRSPTDRLAFASGDIDRLSGTLHSLHKIRDMTRDFDVLFIDEADSVMNNLLFARIIDEEIRFQLREVLFELISYTKLVILSDGDISEETVSQYIELVDGDRDFYRINHQRPNLKNVTAYKHPSESSIWGAVQGYLELGHKCLVVTDQGPEPLNVAKNTLDRIFTDKNIQVAHANSKIDEPVRDIINNTDNALHRRKVDALLCSPSVTNGVDFSYFDTTFVITKTSNHTPNMRFQALMRERSPKEIHYFFSNIKGYVTGYKNSHLQTGWFDKARHTYALRREKEFRTYVGTFNYYLYKAGCKVESIIEPYESPITLEDKALYHVERITAICNSSPTKVIARHNDAYEEKERLKYYYDLEEEPSYETVELYVDHNPHGCSEFLHAIFPHFWDVIKTANPYKVMEALDQKGKLFFLATGQQAKANIWQAKQVLRNCGIESEDDIPDVVAIYKKYCALEGHEVPIELTTSEETTREIF